MNRRTLLAGFGVSLLAGCAPSLGLFDAVAPRDAGVRQVARDAAYGALPRQTLDVYRPADAAPAMPVIVFIHGGSWRSGDKRDYGFVGAAFASRGFLAVLPNYRLVPEARFPTFVEDCAAAVRWTQDHAAAHGGDPRRIVLVGHSAGAYNAAMLTLDARFLAGAGVDARNVQGFAGLAGPYDFLPFDVDATRDAFGEAPDSAATQPVNFVRADAAPMLLLWGEDDTTVGRRSIDGLARAQRAVGGAVETKVYPGIDHVEIMLALSRPLRGRAPVLADVTAFARRVTA